MATANDTFELVNFFEATNTSYEVNAVGSSKSNAKKKVVKK
jgi:ribonucleoside-diphosphate reductase beta chain